MKNGEGRTENADWRGVPAPNSRRERGSHTSVTEPGAERTRGGTGWCIVSPGTGGVSAP